MSGARQRVPAPLLRSRLPSGVGSMLQPNVTGDGDARLTARFWTMVVLTGVATGLLGDALMFLLFSIEHLAFGVNGNDSSFTAAVADASGWHRVLPLLVAGAFGGPAWYLLRRYTPGKKSEVDEVLWTGEGRLSFRRSLGTSVISEIVIGLGASLQVIVPNDTGSGVTANGQPPAPSLEGNVDGAYGLPMIRSSRS